MNVVREIDRINRKQLDLGDEASWHDDFKDSAYIYVGGIPYELTEGDIICVFSQYGEILDINLVRDRETGKSKGFCFLKYDDQRSTVLAVDNFNGATLLGRTLRVDHSRDYRQLKKKKRKGHENSETESSSEEELDEDGEPRVKGFNVAPKGWLDPLVEESESEVDSVEEGIDPDDPMREYLIEKRLEERAAKEGRKQKKHRRKRIKEEDEEGETRHRHRHRHRSEKAGEDRHRHRRHRHEGERPRIEGGESRRRESDDRHRRDNEDEEDMRHQRNREDTPEARPRTHERDVSSDGRPRRDERSHVPETRPPYRDDDTINRRRRPDTVDEVR